MIKFQISNNIVPPRFLFLVWVQSRDHATNIPHSFELAHIRYEWYLMYLIWCNFLEIFDLFRFSGNFCNQEHQFTKIKRTYAWNLLYLTHILETFFIMSQHASTKYRAFQPPAMKLMSASIRHQQWWIFYFHAYSPKPLSPRLHTQYKVTPITRKS